MSLNRIHKSLKFKINRVTTFYFEVLLNGVSNYQELHLVYGSLTIVENTPVLLPGTIIWELPWEIFALSSVSHTCSVRELSQNTIFLFKGVDTIIPTSLKEKSIKLEVLSCHGPFISILYTGIVVLYDL